MTLIVMRESSPTSQFTDEELDTDSPAVGSMNGVEDLRNKAEGGEGKILYAVLYNVYDWVDDGRGRKHWTMVDTGEHKMHAEDALHAHNTFCYVFPDRNKYEIVGVAPVIGAHALDDNGDRLVC